MKVLMFGWEFPPFISGGLGTACFGITKGLCSLGIEIDFVLPKVAQQAKTNSAVNIIDASQVSIKKYFENEEFYKEYITFIEVNSMLRPYSTEESYKEQLEEFQKNQKIKHEVLGTILDFEGGYGKDLMLEVFRLRQVGSELGDTTNAQIIHAHDWMTFPAAIAAKQASGLPLVVHIHATEFDRSGEKINKQLYEIEREGADAADLIIAVSNRTKDIIVNNYGIDKNKVSVVYNAVDKSAISSLDTLEKTFKEPVVLFLGRVTGQKGPSYFLETARIVLQKMKNVRFVMAGSGDLLSEMVKLCASMRLQDRFHFTGFLRGKELQHIFSLSDVLVMPSVSEPFGIVPIEAIQYDLPVIISKQSGVSEILPHAIKVDFWDTELFAKSIIEILKSPKKKEKQIAENRATMEGIHWNLSAVKILNAYERVLKK